MKRSCLSSLLGIAIVASALLGTDAQDQRTEVKAYSAVLPLRGTLPA
jgi:hypothetical protein